MPAAASSRHSDRAMQLGEVIMFLRQTRRWQAVRDWGRRGSFWQDATLNCVLEREFWARLFTLDFTSDSGRFRSLHVTVTVHVHLHGHGMMPHGSIQGIPMLLAHVESRIRSTLEYAPAFVQGMHSAPLPCATYYRGSICCSWHC